MSDVALKPMGVSNPGWQPRPKTENGVKVLELGAAGSASSDSRQAGAVQRDWSSALDLIQEASEAIRLSEERSGDLEAELRDLSAKSAETTRQFEAQLAGLERRLAKMEERARAAEARANDSEAWLVRVNDSLVAAFGHRKPYAAEDAPVGPISGFETAAE
jgi:predicted  nucleic acid-binding Zn-ribbon protein